MGTDEVCGSSKVIAFFIRVDDHRQEDFGCPGVFLFLYTGPSKDPVRVEATDRSCSPSSDVCQHLAVHSLAAS